MVRQRSKSPPRRSLPRFDACSLAEPGGLLAQSAQELLALGGEALDPAAQVRESEVTHAGGDALEVDAEVGRAGQDRRRCCADHRSTGDGHRETAQGHRTGTDGRAAGERAAAPTAAALTTRTTEHPTDEPGPRHLTTGHRPGHAAGRVVAQVLVRRQLRVEPVPHLLALRRGEPGEGVVVHLLDLVGVRRAEQVVVLREGDLVGVACPWCRCGCRTAAGRTAAAGCAAAGRTAAGPAAAAVSGRRPSACPPRRGRCRASRSHPRCRARSAGRRRRRSPARAASASACR